MIKNLIENYENQDMIGMADCLLEKSMLFVQFINQTNEQQKGTFQNMNMFEKNIATIGKYMAKGGRIYGKETICNKGTVR